MSSTPLGVSCHEALMCETLKQQAKPGGSQYRTPWAKIAFLLEVEYLRYIVTVQDANNRAPSMSPSFPLKLGFTTLWVDVVILAPSIKEEQWPT